ncbi:MAG: hypothetical protein ACFFE4_08100 [Candidatus Thorarchaeota archaeon]
MSGKIIIPTTETIKNAVLTPRTSIKGPETYPKSGIIAYELVKIIP